MPPQMPPSKQPLTVWLTVCAALQPAPRLAVGGFLLERLWFICIGSLSLEVLTIDNRDRLKKEANPQLVAFQRATKWLIVLGQTVGLMPVLGVLSKPPATIRQVWFKVLSFRFLYSVILGASQTMIAVICVQRLFRASLSVKSISFVLFYSASAATTILFIQAATKWPNLIQELPHYKLDEYVDPRIKIKCNVAITIFLASAIVEHIFSLLSAYAATLSCSSDYGWIFYSRFIKYSFPWIAELGLPDNFIIRLTTQFLNITATLAWSYSDLFIVCISLYLSSILEGINNKLVKNKNKLQYSCSKFWVSMREDYSRAAQLVRAFDDVTCVVVFASFATNLIFICLQLYNLLSDGVRQKMNSKNCPNISQGPLGGYENVIYFTYSMVFVLFRYLSVSLVAARVHTSSQSLAPALYGVPSSVYNVEVQRFLDQVQHDTVALSGLQFFYVTKSLVLTVAGTIFTYELVLLQYGG
ncbi:gustatory receptor for sugar taste 64b-like [Choristoneura fumiferana]|uniref:gustatory receptor for sugar taste 64b-like n=1 Tax=Choristoneura fumiferana TaxID=7141 RepID=UPI003D153CEF